jgi:hypothetical protein
MSRRSRKAQRILHEQNTVGMQRDERKEQEELAGKKKIEGALTKVHRMGKLQEKEIASNVHPRRAGRAGKPLKR